MPRIVPFSIKRHYDGVRLLWRSCEGIRFDETSDSREAITAYVARNPDLSFVAVGEETGPNPGQEHVIGSVLGGHDGRRGYLHHVAVSRAYRGQGTGAALVNAALDALGRVGIGKCHVFVLSDNPQGRAFWQKQGWQWRTDVGIMSANIGGISPRVR